MTWLVLALLVIFQLKHFVADYPLQRPWMLGKFKDKGWVLPLAAHAAVHGLLTFAIAYVFTHNFGLAVALMHFDFIIHFAMDRIKASRRWLGRWKALTPEEFKQHTDMVKHHDAQDAWDSHFRTRSEEKLRSNRLFWHSIGFDQMIHHFTHYAIIWALVH